MGPLVAVAVYLVATRPTFNGSTAFVVIVVGAIVGAAASLRPEISVTPAGPLLRRPVTPLVLSAVAYLVGVSIPLLVESPEGRAAGALVALAASAIAVGVALALLPRTASSRPNAG
jgi:hypothetical protein